MAMRKLLGTGGLILLMLTVSACLDLFEPGCDDCGTKPHWEYTCIGWIAPVCDTYCVSTTEDGGVRLLDDCCCGSRSGSISPQADEDPEWRPLRHRAGPSAVPSPSPSGSSR